MDRIQLTLALICITVWPWSLLGQDTTEQGPKAAGKPASPPQKDFVGFVDKDNDGINDKFRDINGDGKNDIDGKAYQYKFGFKDKNKDKINDLWMDRDGDGVNDLASKLTGKEQKDIHHNVLDVNRDGCNDITGTKFDVSKKQWQGEKWGFWNETQGKLQGRMIDMDGDGIDDRLRGYGHSSKDDRHGHRTSDMFIDEDGDGICDGRSDMVGRMGRSRHSGSRDNQSGMSRHHH
jgi:hypothetical protein